MIHEALLSAIDRPRPRYKSSGKMRLWVSELGYCPRKASLRIMGREPTGEFPVKIKEVMSLGNSYEDNTYGWLVKSFGSQISQGVAIGNDCWSGKIDFLLAAGNGRPNRTIIEHKATNNRYFDFHQNLPLPNHVCQAWMYGFLARQKWPDDLPPKIILFYRAWSSYAEFELVEHEEGVRAQGTLNGEDVSRWLWLKPDEKRLELEEWFLRNEIPDTPSEPSAETGCLFRGEPSCTYFSTCFPDS